MGRKIRVLVVDDSALVRKILSRGLSAAPDIEVVGAAADPYAARDLIVSARPDVMTLDVEMPRMNGLEFLQRLIPQHPMPVVMVSSLTLRGAQITFDALAAGAVDFVLKPVAGTGRGSPEMIGELCEKVRAASVVNMTAWKANQSQGRSSSFVKMQKSLPHSTDTIIAIGASTGGTEAVAAVVNCFPADMPGVVVVQHMPAGYTACFASRLDRESQMSAREAADGDRIVPGEILVAPGDKHMIVQRRAGSSRIALTDHDRVSGHRPSVDVLFESLAKEAGAKAVGVILTGMGNDGAGGMLAMRQAGAHTVAQDKATSIVFGMPKVAIEKGGAERVKPLDEIAPTVADFLNRESECPS